MQTVTSEWQAVPGFNEVLEASRDGSLRARGKVISQGFNGNRAVAYFRNAGKVRGVAVATAIASTFIRPLLPNEIISWVDGNRKNNHVDNLQIVVSKRGVRRKKAV